MDDDPEWQEAPNNAENEAMMPMQSFQANFGRVPKSVYRSNIF